MGDAFKSASISQSGDTLEKTTRLSDQYDSVGRKSGQFYGTDEGEFDQSNELEFFGGRMSQQFTALDPELLKAKKSHSSKTTILIVVLILLIGLLLALTFLL